MSWAAAGYVKGLTHGANGEPLTRTEKLVLMVLADYYNDEDGCAWPSATRLAREALVTREVVWRVLKRLAHKGLIVAEERRATNGAFTNNCYRLPGLPSIYTAPSNRGVTSPSDPRLLGSNPPVTTPSNRGVTSLVTRQPTIEPLIEPTVEPTKNDERGASSAAAIAVLDTFNATLLGEKGYEPSPAFLLKVREKYGHLDLEEEALKARDWAKHHRRACSQGFVLNWLKKAAADKTAQVAAAKPVKPVVRNEPPPLPGPVVPASPEVRAEYDAIRNGRRPKPVTGNPADFERKRAEALAAAQARIGAMP